MKDKDIFEYLEFIKIQYFGHSVSGNVNPRPWVIIKNKLRISQKR